MGLVVTAELDVTEVMEVGWTMLRLMALRLKLMRLGRKVEKHLSPKSRLSSRR